MGAALDRGWVFISYRREDTAPYARLLQYELRERIPGVNVFMDVDSIQPGQDFVEAIQQAVSACDVMLVLIGRHWLTVTDQDGRRRLAGLDDQAYRAALQALFAAARSAGLVFEWGAVGTPIRLYTRDRAEPLTVAWVFPEQGGWYGLRHVTLGFDRGSAAQTPSVQPMLDEYVDAVARISGATPVRPRSLRAYTFAPDAVRAHHRELIDALVTLSRKVQQAT